MSRAELKTNLSFTQAKTDASLKFLLSCDGSVGYERLASTFAVVKARELLRATIEALKSRGHRQREIAAWMGVSEQRLSQVLNKPDTTLPLDRLDALARHAGVHPGDLFHPETLSARNRTDTADTKAVTPSDRRASYKVPLSQAGADDASAAQARILELEQINADLEHRNAELKADLAAARRVIEDAAENVGRIDERGTKAGPATRCASSRRRRH